MDVKKININQSEPTYNIIASDIVDGAVTTEKLADNAMSQAMTTAIVSEKNRAEAAEKAVSDCISELSSHLCDAGIQYPYMFANEKWYDPNSSHIIFQIYPGAIITLQPTSGVYYSLLKTYNPPSADGEAYSQDMFATGYSNRVYTSSKIMIHAPSDAKYLYIACNAGTVFDVISILTVNGISLLDKLIQKLVKLSNSTVNLIEYTLLHTYGLLELNSYYFSDRKLIGINDGEESLSTSRYTTDFILINAETDRINAVGLQSNGDYASIAMYNADKEYIAGYANDTLKDYKCSPNTAFIKLCANESTIDVVSVTIYRIGYVNTSDLYEKINIVDKKTQMVRGDVAVDITGELGVGGILADGSYSPNTSCKCSYFIPVERPKKYRVKGHRGSAGWLVVCFYDKDKQPLVSESPEQNGLSIDITFQPSFATAYVRISGLNNNNNLELYEVSESVGEEIAKLKLDIFKELIITPEWFFDKVYLYTDGTFPVASNRLTTDFIPVNGGEIIEYTNLQVTDEKVIDSIATYDANKIIIPAGCINNRSGAHRLPSNTAYIRLSAYPDLTGTIVVIKDQSFINAEKTSHWVNEYQGIFDGTHFKEKYLKREDDITILVIGDSLSAFHNQASYENQANRPCQMICHNWVGNLWDYLNDIKITADRFDSTINVFTEVGTFEEGDSIFQNLPYWTADAMTNNGKTQSGSWTRYSNTPNASVTFNWDLNSYENLHFIHRKDYRAADNVTINISEGNDQVLVLDESTNNWVEANGYQFTQKIDQSTKGSGYSQTLSNWRLKMKKVTNATSSVTLTFTASGSGYFFYWGTERWNGNRLIIVNSSRGGRECIYFQDVIRNDITERKPDLVLVSCMLINEYGDVAGKTHLSQTVVDNFQDLFIGDRAGHTTDLSLKVQSDNWDNFDVIAIIPHIRYEYFNEDSNTTFKKTNIYDYPNYYMDEIAPVVWNRVKNMLMNKGVKVIDVGLALKREILSMGLSYKDAFNSHGVYASNGVTQDTVHQNVLGSMLWAKHIAPIFDI